MSLADAAADAVGPVLTALSGLGAPAWALVAIGALAVAVFGWRVVPKLLQWKRERPTDVDEGGVVIDLRAREGGGEPGGGSTGGMG